VAEEGERGEKGVLPRRGNMNKTARTLERDFSEPTSQRANSATEGTPPPTLSIRRGRGGAVALSGTGGYGRVGLTGVAEGGEVAADLLELAGWHGDLGVVLGLWDSEVLGVDDHELHLEVGDLLLVRGLKHEGDNLGVLRESSGVRNRREEREQRD